MLFYLFLFVVDYYFGLCCPFAIFFGSSSQSLSSSSLSFAFSFSENARHYHVQQFQRLVQSSIMSTRVSAFCQRQMKPLIHHFQNCISFSFYFIFFIIHIIIQNIFFMCLNNLMIRNNIINQFLLKIFSCLRGFVLKKIAKGQHKPSRSTASTGSRTYLIMQHLHSKPNIIEEKDPNQQEQLVGPLTAVMANLANKSITEIIEIAAHVQHFCSRFSYWLK